MTSGPFHAFVAPATSGFGLGGVRQGSGRVPAPSGKLKYDGAGQSLWSTFWQEFSLENAPQDRCYVPGDGRQAVDQHWMRLADGLHDGARVIDLGCGAGVVGSTLLRRRKDLHINGVDWANVPKTNLTNLTIHPWVRMEDLPFGDKCFDAAVSLFGIEYGNIEKTALELERVLKTGARFSFLVHHRASEIVREGSARRRALKELIYGKMKLAFLAGNGAGIEQQRARLRTQFPLEPMVKLVSDYFIRNIARARAERHSLWQKLAEGLDPEIALLLHLERSAKSVTEMASWLASLLSNMNSVRVAVLTRSSGEPIAWDVSGTR